MKAWWMWWGGSGYGPPEFPGDVEEFDSLQDVTQEFQSRIDGYSCDGLRTPCVEAIPEDDGGPSAWVFLYDPRVNGSGDVYPDKIITCGPRGGVKMERC